MCHAFCLTAAGYTLKSRSTLLECLEINPSLEEALQWQKEREAIIVAGPFLSSRLLF